MSSHRVLVVDGGKQKKYVQLGSTTPESVTEFLNSFVAGEAKEYGLTDSV
ncbi:hypothetical protein IT417_03725 [bacterium]|nr:hypothetical protein [bacterium]